MSNTATDTTGDVGWITIGTKSGNKSSQATKRAAIAPLRLAKELKQLAKHPVHGITAAPLGDDLLMWHATVSVEHGALKGGLFHFVLEFGKDYPSKPPRVSPVLGIPHLNCQATNNRWVVCSDVLQTQGWANEEGKAYKGWSSIYTVESILLQLQLLLLEVKEGHQAERCLERARAYRCPDCGHSHADPKPEAPEAEDEGDSKILVVPTRQQEVVARNLYEKLMIMGEAYRLSEGWKLPEKFNSWESGGMALLKNGAAGTPKKRKLENATPVECPRGYRINVLRPGQPLTCPIVETRKWDVADSPPQFSKEHYFGTVMKDNGSATVLVQYSDPRVDEVLVPFGRAIVPRSLLRLQRPKPENVKTGELLKAGDYVWSPIRLQGGGFSTDRLKAKVLKDNGSNKVLVEFHDSRVTKANCPFNRLIIPRTLLLRTFPLPRLYVPINPKKTARPATAGSSKAPCLPTAPLSSMLPLAAPLNMAPTASGALLPGSSASACPSQAPTAPGSALALSDRSSTHGRSTPPEEAEVDVEADPFMDVGRKGIRSGDLVLLKDGRRGQIKTVVNGGIFSVLFEGEPKAEMVTRGLVAFWKRGQRATPAPATKTGGSQKRCFFTDLGTSSLWHIFEFLSVKELARTACVCKEFKRYSEEGYLWRTVFSRRFPRSQLSPGAMASWKHIFAMETEQIFDQLTCYYTKKGFSQTILGIPIVYDINPKKNIIQYMYSPHDFLSLEAFSSYKVRRSKWQEPFTNWLPIYITYDHFKRGQQELVKQLMKLAKLSNPARWRQNMKVFDPLMVLDILPKLLKTFTVLIADKGIENSEQALHGYVTVHRLFMALCLEYPKLRRGVDAAIKEFMKGENSRSKHNCPDLGEFITLLSVSDKYTWADVIPHLTRESFDRSVLWVCRDFPEIHELRPKSPRPALSAAAKNWFKASTVGRRIMMFQAFFAREFKGRRSVLEQATYYDRYFGRPCSADMRKFQEGVAEILAVSEDTNERRGWLRYFKKVGVLPQSMDQIGLMIARSVHNSKRRGYTKNNMRFDLIHSSGVGKILMKGESYSINPSAKRINVEDLWSCTHGFTYLDASVLFFDQNGIYDAKLDYSSTVRYNGAVQHSGDIVDGQNGRHEISISLDLLPASVHRLVFTATAWTGNFRRISEPYIRLCDENNTELCRHSVAHLIQANPSKTLCIFGEMRRTKGKAAKWEFKALSEIGQGTVRDYEEIVRQIPGAKWC